MHVHTSDQLRRITIIAVAALALLFGGLAGCDYGDDEDDMGAVDSEPTATGGEANREVNTIQVNLTEFSIDMPSSIQAGMTAFEVTNDGTVEHNFEVEGQGIEEEFESNLEPGETKTLEIDLEPGTYEAYCPVADHEEQGMQLELAVEQ